MAGTQDFFNEIKSEVKDLGAKMNRLFDEVVRGKDGEVYLPVADVYENLSQFVFQLDLPGFEKSDVGIQIRDNNLVIKGSRSRAEHTNAKFHMRERSFGEFERNFSVPAGVSQENVKAKFENGVLTVTLQKESVEVKEESSIEIE